MDTHLLQRLFKAIGRWHIRRTTIRTLSALDDRMLRDIGIDRSELRTVVDDLLTRPLPEGKIATSLNDRQPNPNIGIEARQW